MGLFKKILIANRGEIAVRIIKTARRMGIKTVAVFAEDDEHSLHVSLADEAVLLDGLLLNDTYLNQGKLVQLAIEKGVDAIHPGYGFLSENTGFAQKVERSGLIFIGATPEQISLMGEKTKAIDLAKKLGVPVIPGICAAPSVILKEVSSLSFPLLVKASGGGGGKGMQVVSEPDGLPVALKKAERQAKKYFGNGEVFVEKYLPSVRHIEIQIFGDGNGHAVHLFERECSIQRRYQKLIEEAPAVSVSSPLKERLYQTALKIAADIKYRGAGTVEFLVDENERFYFLEMNTRLQVEHPVTEMITGLDLVEWQIRIASGLGLPLKQEEIEQRGHALELRVCSEDVEEDFLPSAGLIEKMQISEVSGFRFESFISEGLRLSPTYDSLLGKLIVSDINRESALRKMMSITDKIMIAGIKTNLSFLQQIIKNECFIKNRIDTRFVENHLEEIKNSLADERNKLSVYVPSVAYLLYHFCLSNNTGSNWERLGYWRFIQEFKIEVEGLNVLVKIERKNTGFEMLINRLPVQVTLVGQTGSELGFTINGKKVIAMIAELDGKTRVQINGHPFDVRSNQVLNQVVLSKKEILRREQRDVNIFADFFGRIIETNVKQGDKVQKNQLLLTIESMKTEFRILSPINGVIKKLHVEAGIVVQDRQLLIEFETKNRLTISV